MGNDFVPDDLDASKWENLEPLTRDLLERKLLFRLLRKSQFQTHPN